MAHGWGFYISYFEADKPAAILVDLDAHKRLSTFAAHWLTLVRFKLNLPNEFGHQDRDEEPLLEQFEHGLDHVCPPIADLICFCGRITFNGYRSFFFYTQTPEAADRLRNALAHISTAYDLEVSTTEDPHFGFYQEVLHPDEDEMHSITNQRVLQVLLEKGDKLDTPRNIDHWIYFPDEQSRKTFAKQVKARGFTVQETVPQTNETRPNPLGLVISKEGMVDLPSINDAVLDLFYLAQECGGKYDGWETEVVKG